MNQHETLSSKRIETISTPVAFVIFIRPELTKLVFNEIAKVKPPKLFVISDGPRSKAEESKNQQAKAVIENVDWDCEVFKNYSDENLGAGLREASGFSWVFSQVEEAIFLEDDTLPTLSFFNFCQTLLDFYRDDKRIMHISGNNFQQGRRRTPYSYYFSKYSYSWGWASWRRAWNHYDYYMKSWPEFKRDGLVDYIFENPDEKDYWGEIFGRTYHKPANEIADTWDYQWLYTMWSQNGVSILPNSNLVSNIGFGHPDAAHSGGGTTPFANLPIEDIWEMRHPPFIVKHREADVHDFHFLFRGEPVKNNGDSSKTRFIPKFKNKLKTWL